MRKTSLLGAISLVLSLALLLAACGPAATPTEAPPPEEPETPEEPPEDMGPTTKVAVLLPGPLADGGWNMLAYEGVVGLQEEGFDVAYTESLPQADMPATARGYADDGYDLVIGHGFQFVTSFMEIAPEYPDTYFFATSTAPQGEEVPPNLRFIDPQYHYGGYMAGVLASLVSESHVVGIVGGADNPIQRSIAHAFVQGAEDTVEGTTGLMVITGDYNDAARGREAALTMIGNGADVIFHWANVTGFGAIGAAVESNAKIIGVYSDQTAMAWNNFASSLTMDLRYIIRTLAHEVEDGTFEGGGNWSPPFQEIFNFKAGQGEFNPAIVSPEAADKIHEIEQKVIDGEIVVELVLD